MFPPDVENVDVPSGFDADGDRLELNLRPSDQARPFASGRGHVVADNHVGEGLGDLDARITFRVRLDGPGPP
jgi:hypothetical protein